MVFSAIMLSVVMLSVAFFYCHAECDCAECRYAESHYSECRGVVILVGDKRRKNNIKMFFYESLTGLFRLTS